MAAFGLADSSISPNASSAAHWQEIDLGDPAPPTMENAGRIEGEVTYAPKLNNSVHDATRQSTVSMWPGPRRTRA
eukprot:2443867-Pyramimonas_sp.AAC.1